MVLNNIELIWTGEENKGWWYRLWKAEGVSIWGECGGYIGNTRDSDITVTLPITFSTTFYTLVFGIEMSSTVNGLIDCHVGVNMALSDYKTTSTFKTRVSPVFGKYFYACGPV